MKSYASLDAIVLAAILAITLMVGTPAHAKEGDFTVYSTNDLFDTCRIPTPQASLICGVYIVAIWDLAVSTDAFCVDPGQNNQKAVQTVMSDMIIAIRASSGYVSNQHASQVIIGMFETHGIIYSCDRLQPS